MMLEYMQDKKAVPLDRKIEPPKMTMAEMAALEMKRFRSGVAARGNQAAAHVAALQRKQAEDDIIAHVSARGSVSSRDLKAALSQYPEHRVRDLAGVLVGRGVISRVMKNIDGHRMAVYSAVEV